MPVDTAHRSCSLCGLPTQEPPIRGAGSLASRIYCCAGCAVVDDVLQGLPAVERAEAIVDIARRVGLPGEQVAALEAVAVEARVDKREAELHSEASVDEASASVVEQKFRVSGLHCPSCTWLVEHTLMGQRGVKEAHVDFLTEIASIRLDLKQTSRETALSAIEPVGYKAHELDDVGADPERLHLRFGVAAIAAMNVMMLAFVHYAELVGAGSGRWKVLVGALGATIAVPAVMYCGAPIFRRALGHLIHRRLAMESLLALGIVASLGLSLSAFVLPGANFYFEIPCMIVATALGSRLVDRAIRRVGARKVATLLRPRPLRVRTALEHGSGPAGFTEIDELVEGQRIIVPEGEEVPADVVVVGDALSVSEAVLTGEPRPVLKRRGATVLAGSEVVSGTLLGEVARPARSSAYALIGHQILDVVRGQGERTALADRIAAIFVIVVLAVAAVTVLGHFVMTGRSLSDPAIWLPAIAVLVVACPCAFSIAASASMGVAAIRLLTDGVLLRNPNAFEQAAIVDVVVFDKTGTLTIGDMDVHALEWFDEPEPSILEAVRGLEESSRHPMAVAIRRFLEAEGVAHLPASEIVDVEEIRGLGVRGVVSGRDVAVGAPDIFTDSEEASALDDDELSRPHVLFGPRQRPAGRFIFDDPLRPSAPEAVEQLRRSRIDVELLSGDDGVVVARCAQKLGIETYRGRVLPRDKAAHVESSCEAGRHVIYVGDGINDAPALAAATVGIAMRHGASMSLETADLLSVRDDPTAASVTISLARRLRRVTAQNYVWAIAYNVILVPVAASGWLHPAFAALAMLLSSLTVLANSARLLRRE